MMDLAVKSPLFTLTGVSTADVLEQSHYQAGEEPEPSQTKLISVMYVVAFCTLGLLLFALYLIPKIYSLVKFTDRPLLLSVVSIAMALSCFLTYSILLIVQAQMILAEDNGAYLNSLNGTNVIRAIDYLKVMFTFCGFVFDLYKWGLFIIATSTDVS